jgi:hypothetical protein
MGNSWQTQDQKEFFDEHLASYCSIRDEGKLKEGFWPMVTEEWFKRWPLSEPPADLVEKKESVEKAQKVWKEKKVDVSILDRHLVSARTYPSTADKAGVQGEGYGTRSSKPPEPPPRRWCPAKEV